MLWKCMYVNKHYSTYCQTCRRDYHLIMTSSSGSSFLSSLASELPDGVKLQQQYNRLGDEKIRLLRTAEREEQLLLKYSAMYKSTRFKIVQCEEQMRAIKKQQSASHPGPGRCDSPLGTMMMDI